MSLYASGSATRSGAGVPKTRAPRQSMPGAIAWLVSPTGLLLFGGWLLSLFARAGAIPAQPGLLGRLSFLNPLELIIAGVATYGCIRPLEEERLGFPALAFVLVLLLPGGVPANAALLAFGLWVALGTTGQPQTSALLFAGLGLFNLWIAFNGHLDGSLLLRADAAMVQHVLLVLVPGAWRVATTVGVPGGHHIVIDAGNATLLSLPISLLALVALSAREGHLPSEFPGAAVALSILTLCADTLRLILLAISSDLYGVVHGPFGNVLFDIVAIVLPLLFAWAMPRPEIWEGWTPARAVWLRRRRLPAHGTNLPLQAVLLILMLTLAIGVKATQIGTQPVGLHREQASAAVSSFLAHKIWSDTVVKLPGAADHS